MTFKNSLCCQQIWTEVCGLVISTERQHPSLCCLDQLSGKPCKWHKARDTVLLAESLTVNMSSYNCLMKTSVLLVFPSNLTSTQAHQSFNTVAIIPVRRFNRGTGTRQTVTWKVLSNLYSCGQRDSSASFLRLRHIRLTLPPNVLVRVWWEPLSNFPLGRQVRSFINMYLLFMYQI